MLFSFDYWAVVRGSPFVAEAMRLVEFMTDAKPLLALGQAWAVSPANAEAAADAALQARHPNMIASHAARGLFISTEFWAENGEELEARFATWAAK